VQVDSLLATARTVVQLKNEIALLTASSQHAAQERAVSEADSLKRLQVELSAAIADHAASQDQLQAVEAELLRIQLQVRWIIQYWCSRWFK
jgi:hypothetical protein